MLKTNIIILSNSGEYMRLALNSSSKLVLKCEGAKDRVLLNETVTSFDAHCFKDGSLHIFLTSAGGSLLYLRYKEGEPEVKPVMLGKDSKNKICFVRSLCINGNFHLFYCLDSRNRYLIHQVLSEESVYEPEVIDIIGKRFVYDVVTDDTMNVHIIYASSDGSLKYKKYINSQKVHTEVRKICSCDPRFLCVCFCSDRLFAAYTEQGGGTCNVYLLSVLDSNVKKAVFSVGSNTELALNFKEDTLILHLADNSVCYEIKSDLNLNISRGTPIGKSNGIFGIRCPDGRNSLTRYPVGRDYAPFPGYTDFNRIATLSEQMPKPKGTDAEIFAEKYKNAFDEKILELQKEDFSQSLARIEASLAKLVELAQRALEEFKNQE